MSAAERIGAQAQIRIRDFSVFLTPPRGAVMAMLKGCFDDSRRDAIWSVGGYVGDQHHWEHFEEHWPGALAAAGVPYFHMKEMARRNGVFGKWHPSHEHRDEVAAFMKGLVAVIEASYLTGIISTVRISDLTRFNSERRLSLHAYPLAAYGCMLMAAQRVPEETPVELVFDRVEQVKSKLAKAQEYADSDRSWKEKVCNSVVTTSLPEGIPLKCIPPMRPLTLSRGNLENSRIA